MSRQLAHRLTRLEARLAQVRWFPLEVRYVGDPAPVVETSWSLTVWVHHGWCTTPGHAGGCQPYSVEEEAPYASL